MEQLSRIILLIPHIQVDLFWDLMEIVQFMLFLHLIPKMILNMLSQFMSQTYKNGLITLRKGDELDEMSHL